MYLSNRIKPDTATELRHMNTRTQKLQEHPNHDWPQKIARALKARESGQKLRQDHPPRLSMQHPGTRPVPPQHQQHGPSTNAATPNPPFP